MASGTEWPLGGRERKTGYFHRHKSICWLDATSITISQGAGIIDPGVLERVGGAKMAPRPWGLFSSVSDTWRGIFSDELAPGA